MCFDSGADEAAEEAQRARQEEEARVARIKQGTKRIKDLFYGVTRKTTVGNPLGIGAKYNAGGKYYTKSGAVWTPKTGMSPSTTTTTPTLTQQQGREGNTRNVWVNKTTTVPGQAYPSPEAQFAAALKGGELFGTANTVTTPAQFGEEFFKNRRDAYVNWGTPEVVRQYGDAAKELTYALARSGNLDSSSRGTMASELTRLYNTRKQELVDRGQEYANNARTAVQDAEQNLITTLNATGDAEGAAAAAINRAKALSQPDSYSPLMQLFQDFTSSLGTQAALERAEAYSGRDYAKYGTGLFKPGRIAVS